MRFAWLWLAIAWGSACDDSPPRPPDCAVTCSPDNADCGTIPYEKLPSRCDEVCYWGSCCRLDNGAWSGEIYDGARPMTDAGVAALADEPTR
jgi:hypothetical protein